MSTQYAGVEQANEELVRDTYKAYNDRDFDRGAAALSDDYELTNVPSGDKLRGREGYLTFVRGWSTAFPDSKVDVTNIVASKNTVVVEFTGRGTHQGVLRTPMGDISATGKKVEVPFCDVVTVKNGKVRSLRSYYDAATFMRQLGVNK